ncbi:MAG: hypothetical protein HY881_06920 [Deltaproteobacteria bacterium]|nr:hypothetical protein [Deltaproteobacteria bacterium]
MPEKPERWLTLAAWLMVPPLFGILSVMLGQDANWDLRNYHFYNPYSFLYNRMDFDVLPSQVANFYNPLLYVPFYYAVSLLPPKGVGFLLGWVQGLNFPLLLAIARLVIPATIEGENSPWKQGAICFGISLIGMLGAANISEMGTMFSDNLLSLLILSSLWIVLSAMRHLLVSGWRKKLAVVIGAGFLAGSAIGFKQPAAIYAIGLCAAFFVLKAPFMHRFFLSFFYGIGVLSGIAATGGYWLYEMWTRFKNPLFPYFNLLFQSPMATIGDYRDTQYLPDNIGEALISPFFFGFAPYEFSEVAFRDLRIPILYILLLALLVHRFVDGVSLRPEQRETRTDPVFDSSIRFLLASGVLSYLTWVKMFAIFRYALVIELLAPLGIWLLLDRMISGRFAKYTAAGACLILILATLSPADWGRVSWGEDYFGAKLPVIEKPEDTLVIMAGNDPCAYLIPLFPKAVRFVRIQSYFTGPSSHPNGYDHLMARIISGHTGSMYVLYRSYEKIGVISALDAYGLDLESDSCRVFKPHIESNVAYPLYFCAVSKRHDHE